MKLKTNTTYVDILKIKGFRDKFNKIYKRSRWGKTTDLWLNKELNKWIKIPYSWIWRFNTGKISVFPNLIYRFNKIPASHFVDVGKRTLKLTWRGKRCRTGNTILQEKNKADWHYSKSCYKSINKDSVVLAKEQPKRSMKQSKQSGNRPTKIWPTDLWQRRKGNTMEQRWFFQQIMIEQVDIHIQKNKSRHRYYTIH